MKLKPIIARTHATHTPFNPFRGLPATNTSPPQNGGLTTEQMLETMASEGRLPAHLIPLWQDVQSLRGFDLRMALDEVELNLTREVVIGDAERVAVILWIAHTYVYELFPLTPRLFVTSAGPESGKTRLLSLIADMSRGGLRINGISKAALGRLKDDYGSGLMVALDQLDNALDRRALETGPMLDRLISGADRGAKQVLVEKRPDGALKTEPHDLFYPMALGKIGGLPDVALRSRAIVIRMHPATPEEAAQLSQRAKGTVGENIKPLLTKVLALHCSDIAAAKPAVPSQLINRAADKWRPLLAIADVAGGEWPSRALDAAVELESEEEERPDHLTLLCQVVAATQEWPHDVIFSQELDQKLRKTGWGGSSSKKRGNLLRSVGLKAERYWRDDKQLRGYRIADIRAAAAKYLRPDTCDA
jgi:hypothetical protein